MSSLGILKHISSLNISYSMSKLSPELFFIKSIIILLSEFVLFLHTFRFIVFPSFSIKNNGEPIHCSSPSDNIPILFPSTDASSI